MRKLRMEIVIAVILGGIIPTVLFSRLQNNKPNATLATVVSTVSNKYAEKNDDISLSVLTENGEIIQMPLEEYLISVVLCEMPTDFEIEALKSQAVVARTYALRLAETGGKHSGAAICTNSNCCQGYCLPEEYISKGGTNVGLDRVRSAVLSTEGQVLVYGGDLIEATYFSCSGGKTEDAVSVWGSDIPYLQSTVSPGEEGATHYVDTVTFSSGEFMQQLGANLTGDSSKWIGKITYTKGGGVDEIQIAGQKYKGTTIRQRLGLRSTAFMISVVGNTVTITTKGFGHRVGMSQYGADAMAAQGSNYQQILAHYYSGTELVSYSHN